MVKRFLKGMNSDEQRTIRKALRNLEDFLEENS